MTNTLKDTSSLDVNSKQIIWDSNIKNVLFYPAGGESWDRTGGGKASWYLESTLPNDNFYGQELSTERWSSFNYRGEVGVGLDNALKLTISGSGARGGVTSAGLWSLMGDFDIRLYMNESSYYNEYRGNCASGLTVSAGESQKFRISKYFDGEEIGFATHFVDTLPLKYTRWFDGGFNSLVGEDETTCLRLVRTGEEISAYVSTSSGFTQVGDTISGSLWSSDLDVEIELETSQYNFYDTDFSGFSVSGTLSEIKSFDSDFRGPSLSFPERALITVDGEGLSILDDDDLSLWMRFRQSEDFMFKTCDTKVAASGGRVYYTTASGVLCLDFVGDKASWYTSTEKRSTTAGLAARNFKNTFYVEGTNSFVPDNEVLCIAAKNINGNDFVAVGSSTGIGLLINQTEEKEELSLSGRTQAIKLTSDARLFWNYFDNVSGVGQLNYRVSLGNLIGGDTTFSPTGYYDLNTVPLNIASVDINDISVSEINVNEMVLSHSFGIDYIKNSERITYGPLIVDNPIVDLGFSEFVGVNWHGVLNSMFNVFNIHRSSGWSSIGSTSLKLTLNSSGSVQVGSYGGVYQFVDFTNIDRLYFDYKLVNTAALLDTNYVDFIIKVDGTEVGTYTDFSTSYEKFNSYVDVSAYSGVLVLMFILKSKYEGLCVSTSSFYIDNLRTSQFEPDYGIIPSSTHKVLESVLWLLGDERKIFFALADGFGAIDIDNNSLDFFTDIDGPVSLSSVLSAEYAEYIDVL